MPALASPGINSNNRESGLNRTSFLAAASLVWITGAAAQEQVVQAPRLGEINVTATRSERAIEDTAASVTTIDAQEIERRPVRGIADLIRYEPGVDVRSDPNRFGASGFNIRGLEDNRVLILTDGVRMSDYYDFGIGPFNTSNRNLVDLDSVKRVEIVRGSGSSLYGSDALGGVVAFLTKDPRSRRADRQPRSCASTPDAGLRACVRPGERSRRPRGAPRRQPRGAVRRPHRAAEARPHARGWTSARGAHAGAARDLLRR
jgi:outer membrane cobalamin receptor